MVHCERVDDEEWRSFQGRCIMHTHTHTHSNYVSVECRWSKKTPEGTLKIHCVRCSVSRHEWVQPRGNQVIVSVCFLLHMDVCKRTLCFVRLFCAFSSREKKNLQSRGNIHSVRCRPSGGGRVDTRTPPCNLGNHRSQLMQMKRVVEASNYPVRSPLNHQHTNSHGRTRTNNSVTSWNLDALQHLPLTHLLSSLNDSLFHSVWGADLTHSCFLFGGSRLLLRSSSIHLFSRSMWALAGAQRVS